MCLFILCFSPSFNDLYVSHKAPQDCLVVAGAPHTVVCTIYDSAAAALSPNFVFLLFPIVPNIVWPVCI